MFTGLVQKVGTLEGFQRKESGSAITIRHEAWDTPLVLGESVAVQGACLTVASCTSESFTCDVLDETLQRTTLTGKQAGALINLERALAVGDRFGGHVVSGHVDGTGTVQRFDREANDWLLRITCGPELLQDMVVKGSITIDGISLTIAALDETGVEVRIIPFTREHTSLHTLTNGNTVNLETDILAKHVRRYMDLHHGTATDLTMDDLNRAGFV